MISRKYLLTALAALALSTGFAAPALNAQSPALPGEFPSVVQIRGVTTTGSVFQQTGVVVSKRWVLASGGSLYWQQPSSLVVFDGSKSIAVTTIKTPQAISPIYGSEPFPFSPLPAPSQFVSWLSKGNLVLLGLAGNTSAPVASLVSSSTDLTTLPSTVVWHQGSPAPQIFKESAKALTVAETAPSWIGIGYGVSITAEHVGVGNLAVIPSSSGSPLFVSQAGFLKLAGIGSFCAYGNLHEYLSSPPPIFTRVAQHRDWIDFTILGTPLPQSGVFENLFNAKAGTSYKLPMLYGIGTMKPGSKSEVWLCNAKANSNVFLGVSPSLANKPYMGGIMVPLDPYKVWVVSDAQGTNKIEMNMVGVSPGLIQYIQFWISDTGATNGWAASNGLKMTVQP